MYNLYYYETKLVVCNTCTNTITILRVTSHKISSCSHRCNITQICNSIYKSLNSLLRELESINLQDHLDFNWSPDPNVNFENFMNILTQAKQKCMPRK